MANSAVAPGSSSNDGSGYANWFSGEPNGDGSHSTVGRFDPSIGWNDEGDLSFIQGYIIEWDSIGVSEPTAFALLALGLFQIIVARRRRAGRATVVGTWFR